MTGYLNDFINGNPTEYVPKKKLLDQQVAALPATLDGSTLEGPNSMLDAVNKSISAPEQNLRGRLIAFICQKHEANEFEENFKRCLDWNDLTKDEYVTQLHDPAYNIGELELPFLSAMMEQRYYFWR